MSHGFFQPYEYSWYRSDYVDGLKRKLNESKGIILALINEAVLQDSFEDDEGQKILESARSFLKELNE